MIGQAKYKYSFLFSREETIWKNFRALLLFFVLEKFIHFLILYIESTISKTEDLRWFPGMKRKEEFIYTL